MCALWGIDENGDQVEGHRKGEIQRYWALYKGLSTESLLKKLGKRRRRRRRRVRSSGVARATFRW